MLKRLKVQNFRTLENFEWRPPSGVSVLIGDNGSGKSTLGVVFRLLERFLIDGESVEQVFSTDDRTRWASLMSQRFEFELASPIGDFEYSLFIGFNSQTQAPWVAEESLKLGGRSLYEFDGANGRLFSTPVVSFPFSANRSYLSNVEPQTARTTLMGFGEEFGRVLAVKIDPSRVSALSTRQEPRLNYDGSSFAAWYRWFAANKTELQQKYFDSLVGPLPGFRVLKTREAGKQFETRATIETMRGGHTFSLDELSDGQRQLLVLYLLLQIIEPGTVLFLDEPDNFLSLREIQPWLAELDRVVDEQGAQAFLVSHQAEAMNYLASRNVFVFSRPSKGATQILEFAPEDGSMPSEAMLFGSEASK